jgi:hypothetical protein
MGWTGYSGFTASEAIDHELRNCEVLRKSGSWRIVRAPDGDIALVHCLTERHGTEVAVKLVSADMGPLAVPSRAVLCDYLRRTSGRDRGDYEREWLDRCEVELNRKDASKSIRPGDVIRFTGPIRFSDGVSEDTFTWMGKYRGRRERDGQLVRLPKTWRSQLALSEGGASCTTPSR